MTRPLIGITAQLEAVRWGAWVREAALSPASYSLAVARAGGVPVLLPPGLPGGAARLAARLDGLLFSSGADIDARRYGAEPDELADPPDRLRDAFEFELMRMAIEGRLPFLGICRGLQVLNVARGGSMIQQLPDGVGHGRHTQDQAATAAHRVRIDAGSSLGALLGERVEVRAGHLQAVRRLGSGLRAAAWADDETVEALVLDGHPFGVAVQWHPEEGDDLRIFDELCAVAASTERDLAPCAC
jgi:gamma-glutamyl-gamma-aminobutyrate hydrolase PuuD